MKRAELAPILILVACLAGPVWAQESRDATAEGAQEPAPGLNRDFRNNPMPIGMVIGPQDVLEISVFDLPELSMKKRVAPDGTITLPLVGAVGISGLTSQQAEEQIATLLRAKDIVKDPQVTVFIETYVSRRVSVQGAVTKAGVYEMLGQRTLLDMIGEAGGLNERAGRRIFIYRPNADGTERRIEVDAEALVYEGDPSQNIALAPGDIVLIPYRRMIRIYVTGAVASAGAQEFPADEEVTVLQAVTSAGGTTDEANESRVQVIRRYEDGTKEMFRVNLRRIQKGRDEDLVVQPNDIIVVRESFF